MSKISNYQNTEDAIGLAKIGGEPFTITDVKDSSYEGKPSIYIITKEKFKVEGKPYNNFYTSRTAVMDTLRNIQLREDLKTKPLGPVKCVLTTAKGGGKDYWVLQDV